MLANPSVPPSPSQRKPLSSIDQNSRKRQSTLDCFFAPLKPTRQKNTQHPSPENRSPPVVISSDEEAEAEANASCLVEDNDASDRYDEDEYVRRVKKPRKNLGHAAPKAAKPRSTDIQRKLSSTATGTSRGARQAADQSNLPPISDIPRMFDDLVSRAGKLDKLVHQLNGRPLRVATMCSGTESPLLALRMITRSLFKQTGKKLEIDHIFSCEIEPFKQAYIERNFAPPILFRDVLELEHDYAYALHILPTYLPTQRGFLGADSWGLGTLHMGQKFGSLGTWIF